MPVYYLILAGSLFAGGLSKALPLNMARTAGDLDYRLTATDNFLIYHDHRAQDEAKHVLHGLELAAPHLGAWLGRSRQAALPVIMSATTNEASFANLFTDALELQTMGEGGRDLAWHELTHNYMYLHLKNWLGPAGSVIHLMWLPSWWVEGLAECLSASVGSHRIWGLERLHALTGEWPSYESLHSLYTGRGNASVGYPTSGAFVCHLLSTYGPDRLPKIMETFFHASMPWMWPGAMIPFYGFLPFDSVLHEWTGRPSGRELYDEYKAAALNRWRSEMDQATVKNWRAATEFSSLHGLTHIPGDGFWRLATDNYRTVLTKLALSDSWASHETVKQELQDENLGSSFIKSDDLFVVTRPYRENDYEWWSELTITWKSVTWRIRRQGLVTLLTQMAGQIFWLERRPEGGKLCRKPIQGQKITCGETFSFPRSLYVLQRSPELVMALEDEQMTESQYQIYRVEADGQLRLRAPTTHLKPLASTQQDGALLVLLAAKNREYIRAYSPEQKCLWQAPLSLPTLGIYHAKGQLWARHIRGSDEIFLKVKDLKQGPCTPVGGHDSPLLAAVSGRASSLREAIDASTQASIAAPALRPEPLRARVENEPAPYRYRPVFAFPWIGADALGTQYGVLSVPLMDHMQNDTLRATFLYGSDSRYPQSVLTASTERFKASYQFDLFRYQTYNGNYRDTDGLAKLMYYDEMGGRITRGRYFPKWRLTHQVGLHSSTLRPYIGPQRVRRGHHNRLSTSISAQQSTGRFQFDQSLSGLAAPASINRHFIYNQLGLSLGTAIKLKPFNFDKDRTHVVRFGLEGSRTRGPKQKHLKEVYRPLKTFVPGGGGAANQFNIGLAGPSLLTSARFGENTARLKSSWTFPIKDDLETLVGIVYLERLDFTAFYNYGGAWSGALERSDLIGAHGYNLDLSADIKGFRLNGGIGIGRVVGEDWELYTLFGFDAVIE